MPMEYMNEEARRKATGIESAPVDCVVHTPRPWVAKRLIDNHGVAYSTLYEAHIDIGPCMIWCPVGNQQQEANARLIATAPELLEALEAALNFIDDTKVHTMAVSALEKATSKVV